MMMCAVPSASPGMPARPSCSAPSPRGARRPSPRPPGPRRGRSRRATGRPGPCAQGGRRAASRRPRQCQHVPSKATNTASPRSAGRAAHRGRRRRRDSPSAPAGM
eukprot:12669706-Alexandrium_andersonii.AAC.1